jgi:hypothetical protein
MRSRDDSLEYLSNLLAPIIARVLELGRGPPALMDWIATQRLTLGLSSNGVSPPRELARLLAEKLQSGDLRAETIANAYHSTVRLAQLPPQT